MTPSSNDSSQLQDYRKDIVWFLQRYPVAHLVALFCLLFTGWSLVKALGPDGLARTAREAALGAALYAAVATVLVFFLQRWRWKRQSKASRDA